MANPTRRPPGLPDYPRIGPDEVRAAADAGIREASALYEAAIASAGAEPLDALLGGVSDAARAIWTAYGASGALAPVHPDPEVRAAADEATQRIEAWRASVSRDGRLLAALEGGDPTGLDAEATAVRSRWILALRLAGAGLDSAARGELDRLSARVVELQAAFAANGATDSAAIAVAPGRLAGLPPEIVASLAPGDRPGTVLVPPGLRAVVLERVEDRGVREAILRRWLEIAADANREVMGEIAGIHREMAAILGHPSWLDTRAAGGMLGSARAVDAFLDGLEGPFLTARDVQLDAIREPLRRELGIAPDELVIEDWDVARGLRLLRDAAGTAGSAPDAEFTLESVLDGLRDAVEATFGVRLEESPGALGWHPDVRGLDCTDAATGRAIGTILLDPYARDGKIAGVAGMCDPLAIGGVDPEGVEAPTHVTLVTFFARPADGEPARLGFGDIEALCHELGHALDFMLGSTRYAPLDSEAWIRDWTEAPSQFVGRWAGLPEVLAKLGHDRATGQPLTIDAAREIARANAVGAALELLRFLWFARLDGAMCGPVPIELDTVWREAWPVRGTPPVTDRFCASPLTIIAFGYDGAMYGFPWAQSLLEEIVEAFRGAGPLSPEVGMRYRRELLEPGWSADPATRMRRFLGREPTIEPYLARLRG